MVIEEGVEKYFLGMFFFDDEIVFIVFYFGFVFEIKKEEVKVKVFVVCLSGIGFLKMFVFRLKKELLEI